MMERGDAPADRTEVGGTLMSLLMDFHTFHREMTPKYGLSLGQYVGLRYIAAHQPVRISTLADWACVSRPTATAFIDAMERNGWVQRSRSDEDQRAVALRLRPKALLLLGRVEAEQAKFVSHALARMPRSRRAAGVDWLREVERALRAELAVHSGRTTKTRGT